MSTVRDVSDHVVDIAERVADMADAAQGKGIRRGGMSMRWLTISAAGAGIYALARSDAVTGLVKGAMQDAKARASELPDDLVARARQAKSPATTGNNGGSGSRSRTTTRRKSQSKTGTTSRSRKTASAR